MRRSTILEFDLAQILKLYGYSTDLIIGSAEVNQARQTLSVIVTGEGRSYMGARGQAIMLPDVPEGQLPPQHTLSYYQNDPLAIFMRNECKNHDFFMEEIKNVPVKTCRNCQTQTAYDEKE